MIVRQKKKKKLLPILAITYLCHIEKENENVLNKNF